MAEALDRLREQVGLEQGAAHGSETGFLRGAPAAEPGREAGIEEVQLGLLTILLVRLVKYGGSSRMRNPSSSRLSQLLAVPADTPASRARSS